MAHLLGYARVSTADQHPELQLDALRAAGCYRTFVDTASGALGDRPELTKALDHLRAGDTSWSGSWIASVARCATRLTP